MSHRSQLGYKGSLAAKSQEDHHVLWSGAFSVLPVSNASLLEFVISVT